MEFHWIYPLNRSPASQPQFHVCKFEFQGRNMVYPRPIDPYFLAVILIPEPHFSQNFDPWAPDKRIDPIHVFTQNFILGNFVYLQI